MAEDADFLGVTALDLDGRFVLQLSRTCVRPGTTWFQLHNKDAQDHNLYVEGVAPAVPARAVVPHAAPGAREEGPAELRPGTWRLLCTLPGHESMTATVTVPAP